MDPLLVSVPDTVKDPPVSIMNVVPEATVKSATEVSDDIVT